MKEQILKGQSPTSTWPAYKSEVIEFGHMVLHHSRGISKLTTIVFVIPCCDGHHSPVVNIIQGNNLKFTHKINSN